MADTTNSEGTETPTTAESEEAKQRDQIAHDFAAAKEVVKKDILEKKDASVSETPVRPVLLNKNKSSRARPNAMPVVAAQIAATEPVLSRTGAVFLGAAAETSATEPPASIDVKFDEGDEGGGGGSDEPGMERRDEADSTTDESDEEEEDDAGMTAAAARTAARQRQVAERDARARETTRRRAERQNEPAADVAVAAAAGAAAAAAVEERRLREEETARRAATAAEREERFQRELAESRRFAEPRAQEDAAREAAWMASVPRTSASPAAGSVPPPAQPVTGGAPPTTPPPPIRPRSSSPVLLIAIGLLAAGAAIFLIWKAITSSSATEATTMSAPGVSASSPPTATTSATASAKATASASAEPSAQTTASAQASAPPIKEEPVSDAAVADVVAGSGGKWSGTKSCFIVPRETTGRHKYTADAWTPLPGKPYVDCSGKATAPGTNPDKTPCKGGRDVSMCRVKRAGA